MRIARAAPIAPTRPGTLPRRPRRLSAWRARSTAPCRCPVERRTFRCIHRPS